MRVLATFLCVFLLLMVFGTGSYIWLLWHHYWERVGRLQREQERINSRRSGSSYRFRFSGVAELEESRPVYEVEHVLLEGIATFLKTFC